MATWTSNVTAIDNYVSTSTASGASNIIGASDGTWTTNVYNDGDVEVFAYFGGFPGGTVTAASIDLVCRKEIAGRNNPTAFCRMVLSNGILGSTVDLGKTLTTDTGTLTFTFTSLEVDDLIADGGPSGLEFSFLLQNSGGGGPSTRTHIQVDSATFNVTYTPLPSKQRSRVFMTGL